MMNLKRLVTLFLSVLMAAQCFAALPAGATENTLLISPNPAAAQETGTVLYHKDAPKTYAEGQKLWNSNSSTGIDSEYYLPNGAQESIHLVSFYNNRTSSGSGLPEGETMALVIKDLDLKTADYGEMELTFRYVAFNNYVNISDLNDFQVYASTDGGATWSADYATMKAHNVVSFGNKKTVDGAWGRMYDVVSTDLTALVGEGQVINALKIRPYGDAQGKQYYTSVASISVNGYKNQAPAASGGAVEYITVDEDTLRQIVVDRAYQVALTPWYHTGAEDILTYNGYSDDAAPGKQYYHPNRIYRGPMYTRGPDSTLAMWQSVLNADGKYTGGNDDTRNVWSVIGWDCIQVVAEAWSQITTSRDYYTHLFLWDSKDVTLIGGLKNENKVRSTEALLKAHTDEQIYEAYAQLKLGDHLWGPGHSRLVSVPPNVVYDKNGKINPDISTVAITETAGTIQYYYLTPAGKIVASEDTDVDSYLKEHADYTYLYGTSMRVDRVFTFAGLRGTNYLPLTLKEFREGRVEKQRITVTTDVTAANVVENGFIVIPASNYHINKLTTILTDSSGKVLYEKAQYGETHDFELSTYDPGLNTQLKNLAAGSYKLTVDVASGPVTKVLGKVPTQRVFELDFTV